MPVLPHYRRHGGYVGPNLNNAGGWLTAAWIEAWLRNPQDLVPDTIEPRRNFTDAEVNALTAYLMTLRQSIKPQKTASAACHSVCRSGGRPMKLRLCMSALLLMFHRRPFRLPQARRISQTRSASLCLRHRARLDRCQHVDSTQLSAIPRQTHFLPAMCLVPRGSTPAGPSNRSNLTPVPPLLNDGATLNAESDEFMQNIITLGGSALGKSAMMPPYGKTLSPTEIRAVISFARAIAQPAYQKSGRPGSQYTTK